MTVKIPDPAERLRPAGLHRLIFRDQKPPFLQVIPFNRPVVAVVAHRILQKEDSISELVNMHSNDDSYFAPAFCAYSQEAFASGTVRFADSMALALAAVPSRMRPAMPWVIPASRNRL